MKLFNYNLASCPSITLLTLWLSLVIPCSFVDAQQLAFTQPDRVSPRVDRYGIAGQIGNAFIEYKAGFDLFEVTKYDLTNLNQIWQREIVLPGKGPEVQEVFVIEDKIIVFYTSRQNSKTLLCSISFDSSFNVYNDVSILDEFDRRFGSKGYEYKIKCDAARTLFAIVKLEIRGDNYSAFDAFVINREMTKVNGPKETWEKEWLFDDFVINHNGDLYILLKKEAYSFFENKPNYESINLFVFNAITNYRHNKLISELAHPLVNLKMKQDEVDRSINIAGFYKGDEKNEIEGCFALKYSVDSLREIGNHFHNLDLKLSEKNAKISQIFDKGKMKLLEATSLQIRQDGGLLLLGEVYAKIVRSSPINTGIGGNTSMSSTANPFSANLISYYYEEVLLIEMDDSGNIIWVDILPKMQASDNDNGYYSSFGLYNAGPEIRLFFNEDTKSDAQVTQYIYNTEGEKKLKGMLNAGTYNLLMAHKFSTQLNRSDVIIPCFNTRNEFILAKFSF